MSESPSRGTFVRDRDAARRIKTTATVSILNMALEPKMEIPAQDLPNARRTSEFRFSIFGTTFQGAQIIQSPGSEDDKRHIFRSLVTAGATPLLLSFPLFWTGLATHRLLLLLGLSAYVAWASYWGTVGIASYVADLEARDVPVARAVLGIDLAAHWIGPIVLAAPVAIGILYGALGGGVYEFMKRGKLAKAPEISSK